MSDAFLMGSGGLSAIPREINQHQLAAHTPDTSSTSVTVTIPKTNIDKAIILPFYGFGGIQPGTSRNFQPRYDAFTMEFNSSTELLFTRVGTGDHGCAPHGVLEFPDAKYKETGEVSITTGDDTTTIILDQAISDTNKTFVILTWRSSLSTCEGGMVSFGSWFGDNDRFFIVHYNKSGTMIVNYQVLELR